MFTVQSFRLPLLLTSSAAFFPLLAIIFGKGYNFSAALVLLLSVAFLCSKAQKKQGFSKEKKYYTLCLVFYFSSFLLTFLFSQSDLSTLDNPSKALLSIAVLYAIGSSKITVQQLSRGLLLAGITVGIIALLYHHFYPSVRGFNGNVENAWFKGYMEIQTGGMAAIISASCAYFVIFHLQAGNRATAIAFGLATLLSAYAVFLSESRGIWIGLIVAWVYILTTNLKLLNRKFITIVFIALILGAYFSPQSKIINQRVTATVSNLEDYVYEKNEFTSIGIRLELWKSAIYTFLDNPIIGAGKDGRVVSRLEQGNNGDVDKRISRLTYHAHNQFLEALSVNGLVGLLALLSIFCYPLQVCYKKKVQSDCLSQQVIPELGIISISLMMIFCLSQAFLNHNSGTIFYFLWTAILFASLNSHYKDNIKNARY